MTYWRFSLILLVSQCEAIVRLPDGTGDNAQTSNLDAVFEAQPRSIAGHAFLQRGATVLQPGGVVQMNVSTAEANVDKSDKGFEPHRVQHVELLNKDRFWVLMGVVMLLVGAMVGKLEASSRETATPDRTTGTPEFSLEMWGRLAVCVIGLNVSMLIWGVAQEFLMTNAYVGPNGVAETTPGALTIVFCNRLCTVFFTGMLLKFSGDKFDFGGFWQAGAPAVSNMFASWCQYESLHFVSFPLLTVAKSAKLLPVLCIGSWRGKPVALLDYAEAIVIVCALVVFGFETEAVGRATIVSGVGASLIFCLIMSDAVTPHFQDSLFKNRPDMSALRATFFMATFACTISFAVLLLHGQFYVSVLFFSRHGIALLHVCVLSLCSTLTQFLISYTVKNFGPVTFVIIATTRQVISVGLSALLFQHTLTHLAHISAWIVFGTVILRALRSTKWASGYPSTSALERQGNQAANGQADALSSRLVGSSLRFFHSSSGVGWQLLVCVLAIHVPLTFYSIAQEYFTTHTFDGQLFTYPLFLIAANRTVAGFFTYGILRFNRIPAFRSKTYWASFPAATNWVATLFQYKALYIIRFPMQTLIKTLKVIPVMLCGRVLQNRVYSTLDYIEASLITGLVALFLWDFTLDNEPLQTQVGVTTGVLLMIGYIFFDSFTSNLQDYAFQKEQMEAGQMLFGLQLFEGAASWIGLLLNGELVPAVLFVSAHRGVLLHMSLLAVASACGCYACTVTVELFGPAVFTLLLMSHQLMGLVVSVRLFEHEVNSRGVMCLTVIAMLILTSCLRRTTGGLVKATRRSRGGSGETCADGKGQVEGKPSAQ